MSANIATAATLPEAPAEGSRLGMERFGAKRSQPVATVEPAAADVVDEVRDQVALHDCRRVLEQQRRAQGK